LTSLGASIGAVSLTKGITKSLSSSDDAVKFFSQKTASVNRLDYLQSLDEETINSIFNEIIS